VREEGGVGAGDVDQDMKWGLALRGDGHCGRLLASSRGVFADYGS
jgi:hypothetical protein